MHSAVAHSFYYFSNDLSDQVSMTWCKLVNGLLRNARVRKSTKELEIIDELCVLRKEISWAVNLK